MSPLKNLLACLCLMLSTAASAGVVYTWRTTAATSELRTITGFIELSDAAAATPHVSYQAPECSSWPCNLADPDSPILRFAFKVNDHRLSELDIDLVAGTGYIISNPSFDADFDIVAGRLANLSLFINTFTTTLQIGGDVIEWFSSDYGICPAGCSGARGQFVMADVPEPGSLALLVLACLGAGLASLRRIREYD